MGYERPTLVRLGSLDQLTQTWNKQWGWYDIAWFIPIDDKNPPVHTGS